MSLQLFIPSIRQLAGIITVGTGLAVPALLLAAPPLATTLPSIPVVTPHPTFTGAQLLAVADLPELPVPDQAPEISRTGQDIGTVDPTHAVAATVVTTANLNVRSYPSLTASLIRATVPAGTVGTVETAHLAADGYRWQIVSFSTGQRGWVAVEYVTDVTADTAKRVPPNEPPALPTITVPPTDDATASYQQDQIVPPAPQRVTPGVPSRATSFQVVPPAPPQATPGAPSGVS